MEIAKTPHLEMPLQASPGEAARSGLDGDQHGQGVNILLVDDEPRNLDVLESILVAPDYRLVRAETPDAALLSLIREDFACIVLDIRIPGMTGIELAKLIKMRQRSRYIPIIFLTAFLQDEKDVLQGYDAGAVDYLTKPVNPQILKSKVGVFVDLFRANRALRAANTALELEVAQRQKAEEALIRANALLEARVRERTADLTAANRDLAGSERRYRDLLHALPAAVYMCDTRGGITLFNDAAAELWGSKPEPGDNPWFGPTRIYRPDGTPLSPAELMAGATTEEQGLAGPGGIVIERPDGSLRQILPYPRPIHDGAGAVVGYVNMLVDITERKMAQDALRKSEERLRLALETGRVGVWDWEITSNRVTCSDSLFAVHGIKPEDFDGTIEGLLRLIHPEDREGVRQAIDRGLREDLAMARELRAIRPDGKVIWLFTNAKILRAQGNVVRMIGATMEITEQKEAQRDRAHLAAIVESSGDAIISKNLDGIIRTWNAGAERIFGYKSAEAVGRSIVTLVPPERLAEETGILERLRQGKRIEHFETVRVRKDGSPVQVSVAVSPVKDAQGRIVGAANITRDITRQKRIEQDLERAHQEAVAASQAKDDFLAALSHELRTPLNPVLLLASEAARDPYLPASLREKFDFVSRNVALEARLIDDLLDLTRVTRGKLKLELSNIDAHVVLQDAITVIRAELEQKHIQLSLELAAEQRCIRGDSVRLQQVFWNVLKNAVKFTPEGGRIKVSTQNVSETEELSIRIADTGIGLTDEEIRRIFEPFCQGDHGNHGRGSHQYGGLGLGLAISRRLMELHSGRIHATSGGRGQGATFELRLPLASGRVAHNDFPAPEVSCGVHDRLPPGSGFRILLVEDHDATRNALAELLIRRGFEVVAAASLCEARKRAFEQGPFDLLVSDIGLPDGNGNELMSELRGRNGIRGIALTGYGMEQDVNRAREAGFDAHLIKPVRAQALDEALERVLLVKKPSASSHT